MMTFPRPPRRTGTAVSKHERPDRPDALFVASDRMAFAAIDTLRGGASAAFPITP